MGVEDFFLKIFPKIGDGTSWATEKITIWMAGLFNIEPSVFMAKLITIILFVLLVLIVIKIITFLSKFVKWLLVILFIILIASVTSSIFL